MGQVLGLNSSRTLYVPIDKYTIHTDDAYHEFVNDPSLSDTSTATSNKHNDVCVVYSIN